MNESQLKELDTILGACLVHDNDVRLQAENAISQHINNSPDALIFGLIKLLRTAPVAQTRTLCAIFLRQKVPNGNPALMDTLNSELQHTIKTELLQSLMSEPERYVRSQITDTITEIAEILLYKNGWPELLPFLSECFRSPNETLRVNSLQIFGKLSDSCADAMGPHISSMPQLYGSAMLDSSESVRLAACIASCQTICSLEKEYFKEFQPFIPMILQVLSTTVQNNDEDGAIKLLQGLADAINENATFFRPQLQNISQLLSEIGKLSQLPDGIRQVCAECLVLLCESAPGMVRKSPATIQHVVELALTLMLEFEDDPHWATSQEEGADVIDNSNFGSGEMAVDRVALAIQGDKLRPIIFPLFTSFMQSQDWKYKYVALMALGQVGHVFELDSLPVVEVLAFVKDPHPRLRYAALECIGQYAHDFQPEFQEQFHKMIPQLLNIMADSAHPRVQRHAAATIFNLVEPCEPEDGIVPKYANAILKVMGPLLEDDSTDLMVKEQLVTTIAAVCTAAPEAFSPYYQGFMGMLKQIVAGATSRAMATVRGRAMEAISFMGMAVGPDRFAQDAKDLMAIYVSTIQSGQISADDLCLPYMLNSWPRISEVLGTEFAVYLPTVIPIVLAAASKHEEWEVTELQGGLSPTQLRLESKGFTSTIAEKADACSILCSFAHDLKAAFAPFIGQVLPTLGPLMKFYINDEVRSYAISCMPELLGCALDALKKNQADRDTVKNLYVQIVSAQLDCLPKEPDSELLMTLVSTIQSAVDQGAELGPEGCLDQESLKLVGEALLKVLTSSSERMAERAKWRDEDDYDEVTEAKIAGENRAEDELNFMVSECIGSLMKIHKLSFLPTFEGLLPELMRLVSPTASTPESQKIALFIFDDFVEHMGSHGTPLYQQFVPAMLKYTASPRPELRQAASYGLGLCAQHGGPAFQQYMDKALEVLSTGLSLPNPRSEENASPTDNMISALGRIATKQNRPDLLPQWLQLLPLTKDDGEAAENHGLLCTLLEANEPALLGPDMCNLPKAVAVLCQLLSGELENLDMTTALESRIVSILNRLKQQDGGRLLQSILHSISPQQQGMCQQICESI